MQAEADLSTTTSLDGQPSLSPLLEGQEQADPPPCRSGSPEIPLQEQPSVSDNPRLPSPGSCLVGLRVVAKWSSNGYFYSGTITQDVGGAKYRLLFDDGYECDVLARDVLLCDPLPLETEVTALSEDEYFSAGNRLPVRKMPIARGGGTRGGSKIGPPACSSAFTSGVVKGHRKEAGELFYCIEKDGQRKWYRRTAVILSLEQGNRLREQFGLGPCQPTTPLTRAADISLGAALTQASQMGTTFHVPRWPERSGWVGDHNTEEVLALCALGLCAGLERCGLVSRDGAPRGGLQEGCGCPVPGGGS